MFSDPKMNLEQFGLSPGMVVIDLGVGAGYYAEEAAKLVGSQGRVLGVDVQKELVTNPKKAAEAKKLDNLEAVWGDVEKNGGSKIADGVADAVIVSNILFQVEDKKGLVDEAARILKKGGRIMVIDWLDSFGGLGPHTSQIVNEDKAESLFAGQGFEIDKKIDAGDHHYGFIAKKNF